MKKMLKAGYRVAIREDNVEGGDSVTKSLDRLLKNKK